MPAHTHGSMASLAVGSGKGPGGQVVAQSPQVTLYYEAGPDTNMAAGAVGQTGGGAAHENMAPFQCLNYVISLAGIYPSQA